jgi:hypothetical protein
MGVLLLLVLPGVGLVNADLAWTAARARQPWVDARGGLSAAWPLLAVATGILRRDNWRSEGPDSITRSSPPYAVGHFFVLDLMVPVHDGAMRPSNFWH